MLTEHVLSTEVYERKEDLGGGFRGVVFDRVRKEKHVSEVVSRDEALSWVKHKVHEIMGGAAYKTAALRLKRGSTGYKANIWRHTANNSPYLTTR